MSSARRRDDPGLEQRPPLPLWLKTGYTAFIAVLVPVYWREYGPVNFLWFSNVALLSTVYILWAHQRLLASMMLIAIGLPEMVWIIGFFTRLFTGAELFGLTDYMFDPSIPLFVRALSLYHLVLPGLLVWIVWRLGYDERALIAQTGFGWLILLASYILSDPEGNENWVFGWGGEGQTVMPAPLFLLLLMLAFPLFIYLPSHLLCRRFLGDRRSGASGGGRQPGDLKVQREA